MKDYLSGIFLVAENQFGIGNHVDRGEVGGVGLRITQVRDVDGRLWHVRNGEILRVGSFSQGWVRAVLDILVPYDSKIPQVNNLILASAQKPQQDPQWSPEILGDPEIWGVQDQTGESITILLVFRTRPLQQWAVVRTMRARLKADLDAAGVRIPLVRRPPSGPRTPGASRPPMPAPSQPRPPRPARRRPPEASGRFRVV